MNAEPTSNCNPAFSGRRAERGVLSYAVLTADLDSTAPVKPQITAIITHFNRSDVIGRAVQSVLDQTLKPSEIILVDGKSSPKHAEHLQKYANVARLVLMSEDPGGGGPMRNEGIKAAKGEWLAFLDDDDTWAPEKLERQWQAIAEDPSLDGVTCWLNTHHQDGRREVWSHHTPEHHTLASALEGTPALPGTYLIRKSALDQIGGFDPALRFFEDWDIAIRLLRAGFRIRHLSEPLVNYTLGGAGQATSKWFRHNVGRLRVVYRHADAYRQVFGSNGFRRMMGTALRRAGLERGGVLGRLTYAAGSIGSPRYLAPLLFSGHMSEEGFQYQRTAQ